MRARLWMSIILAVLVAVVGVPADAAPRDPGGAAAPAAGRPVGPPDVLPSGGRWTVTLVTGEVIDVASDADGRVTAQVQEHTGPFRTVRRPDGDLHVIPLAVTGLLDGVLDPELFNVTGLVRQGYDDAGRDTVPLIVERAPGADVATRVASADEQPLPSIGAVAVEVPKADTEAAAALIDELAAAAATGARSAPSGVARVWLDRQVVLERASAGGVPTVPPSAAGVATPAQTAAQLDRNLTQIGADAAWDAGYTGAGATVAVLDTGVDASHPDLADRIVAQENFSDSDGVIDRHGHGTHVASVAVGTGAAAGGARSGVAPDARLLSGKVVDDGGYGQLSQVIAGMEWAAPDADIVNMSLGYGTGSDGGDPLSLALDALAEQHGTLFVVAAGNAGPGGVTVNAPGVAERALTVGAVDGQDETAEFSSRGPVARTFKLKPEVVAPGVDVIAARAADTTMGDAVDDRYTTASGTSMAAPHVAGAAALLLQAHPAWDVDELKNTLVGSATPLGEDGFDVGSGRLDIGVGVTSTVRPAREAVEVSLPDPRTEDHAETLTWANDGDEPVTVTIDAVLGDHPGATGDAVAVEPSTLTLAPGASATATLTIAAGLDPGLYTGAVTASADGSAPARTPVAVHAAPETVELTIASTPPGAEADGAFPVTFVSIANLDDFRMFDLYTGFGGPTFTVEVPAGHYSVTGDVSTGDPDEQIVAQVGDPDVTLSEDTTIAFDGRAAVPLDPTVEGVDTAPPDYASATLFTTPGTGTAGYPLVTEIYAWHPMAPMHLTPMTGDAENFAATQTYRVQSPHLTARTGTDPIAIAPVRAARPPEEGEHTHPVVDAGDGVDLSPARDALAVVDLPADETERVAVTRRAEEAGVALLAFVDEQRTYLTLDAWAFFDPDRKWGDVPVVAAPGEAARDLRAAAAGGREVTVSVRASEHVYDIVTAEAPTVDPAPTIDEAAQERLATITERFHRDPDGAGSTADRRYSELNLMNLDSMGPLPEHRTSHVSPDVPWTSMAIGPETLENEWTGELDVFETALSIGQTRTYQPGSRHDVTWLRRPAWPGPVGDIAQGTSSCQPAPVARSAERLDVWLSPYQDRLDGFGCSSTRDATLVLERDGEPVPELEEDFPMPEAGRFPVPTEAADYRLTYEQEGPSPYAHRSSTTWTFRSGAPEDDGAALVPLLVVGYQLPLDTLNQPTHRVARLDVRQVTGAPESRVRRVRAWTSTDGGDTWRRALVHRTLGGAHVLVLPAVDPGTAVSLRVEAHDAAGATVDQTLYDAYTG